MLGLPIALISIASMQWGITVGFIESIPTLDHELTLDPYRMRAKAQAVEAWPGFPAIAMKMESLTSAILQKEPTTAKGQLKVHPKHITWEGATMVTGEEDRDEGKMGAATSDGQR